MTTVVIFHSVLGIREGELDAAARLHADGHEVIVPDLYDGRVFDDYEPAMEWARQQPEGFRQQRALASVAELSDGFVVGGFSMGSSNAVYVATRRRVSGVLQFAGLNPVEWFGDDAVWPTGVDSQSHQKVDDPFRDPVEQQALADVAAAGATLELFDYPGTGHLFTDPTLPDEYDPEATELLWSRVLPFVAARSGQG
ncbi:dienelactone hydrolase family protein [Conyzicola nivalis]|uniref:Dienelactone hydrolase n=2 Tax=Conyzicola nivalis TaxID=1477021 RepID=A0A916ST69_9MICO|nr:dienelactone hydrolase [Conyzicola nivalis]